MFNTRNEGFKVTFPNGYTVSIGTGSMHYCENHTLGGPMVDKPWDSKDCEIAVIQNEDGEKTKYVLSNDVEGYVTPMQFARVIAYVSSLPVAEDIVCKSLLRDLRLSTLGEIFD